MALFKLDEDKKILLNLSAFKYLQEQRMADRPEILLEQELLALAGISIELFS